MNLLLVIHSWLILSREPSLLNVSVMLQMGEEVSPSPPLHWFPLATEQLRLRALTDIYLLHPTHGLVANYFPVSGHASEV